MTLPMANQPEPAGGEPLAGKLAELGAVTPMEQRWRSLVPWLISPLVHVVLLLFGFAITWTVIASQKEESVEIIADFYAPVYDPLAKMDLEASTDTPKLQETLTPAEIITPEQIAETPMAEIDPLRTFSDAQAMSSLAEFAPKAAEGSASFVGLKATNARRIVYVIDASGSMLRSLKYVVEELSRSLDGLSPRQSYGIVFYQRAEAIVVPPERELSRATSEAKITSLEWIDNNIIPSGNSNPLAALEAAIKLKPDAIFVLSDNITGAGQFEIDQQDLLEMLDRLNPVDPATGKRTTQINCIQFLDPDPLNTLAEIARIHGGQNGYRFLDRRELGLAAP